MVEVQYYYGGYPENSKVGDYVMKYLQRDIDERKLDRLFRFVTYNHAVRFGAPGISDIEKAINEALYKKKGEDVHKVGFYSTEEKERPNTVEEDIALNELWKDYNKK